ncbi:MAG: hypothetical protein RMK84_10420 [Oscillochloridaceae bacterium]|nr:hypothetical protein [Chloroflexaceae bacterium]MDW8390528.1 hypothetical protein [Oscillochloridaceae bacterium]
MPVHLQIACDEERCRVSLADAPGAPLAETPRAELPTMADVLGDPPGAAGGRQGDPYGAGYRLFAALGGEALWRMLDASDDGLLLLECDDAAAGVPWEYAATAARRFLACDYAMLRLEPRAPRLSRLDQPPRLLVVCADPGVPRWRAAGLRPRF